MPFIPLANGIRLATEFTLSGQLVVNVYYLTYPTPAVSVNLTQAAQIFIDWWTAEGGPNFSSAIALDRVVATAIDVASGAQEVVQPVTPIAGSLSGAVLPNNIAIVVGQATGFSGRSFRGRKYFAGLTEPQVTGNTVATGDMASILNDVSILNSDWIAADFQWVVASFYSLGAPRVAGVATPVTSFYADTRVDTQRKRLPGEGA